MVKLFWNSLRVSPAILGAALALSSAAQAAESTTKTEAIATEATTFEIAQVQLDEPTSQNSSQQDLLNQIDSYSNEGQESTNDQVTSVSELQDVSPTEWAYEALRSLVERYGCIVGYPDRTYRGNRALTRWEFAAGLNACMNTMERLIQEGVAVLREDIEKLKRLMQEFEAELAALGARVDNLEGRVAFLEDHQFSTTTKLQGEVIFGATNSAGSNNTNQFVFQDRVRLNFNTSFTGEDRLLTRLEAGNAELFRRQVRNRPYEGFFETDTGLEFIPGRFFTDDSRSNDFVSPASTQTFQEDRTDNDIEIDRVTYTAPLKFSDTFQIDTFVSAFGARWDDFVPTLNSYFEDFDGGNGSLSTFAQRNPIYRIGGGAGAGFSVKLGFLEGLLGPSSITAGYLSGTAADPEEGSGLFNGNSAALGQFNFNLFDRVNVAFTYVHAYHRNDSAIFGEGERGLDEAVDSDADFDTTNVGKVGTELANLSTTALQRAIGGGDIFFDNGQRTVPVTGDVFLDSASARAGSEDLPQEITDLGIPQFNPFDQLGGKVTNSYGMELDWRVTDWMNFSAFGSYTDVILVNRGSADIWTYGGGLAFPDLFKEGNLLGVFAGVQPWLGRFNLAGTLGFPEGTSRAQPVTVELFYRYQINDNLSVTPGVIWISKPSQLPNPKDEVIGTLRGTFSF